MTFELDKNFWWVLLVAVIFTVGFTLAAQFSWYILAILLLMAIIFLFLAYPEIGIYLMALLYPFNYLEIIYGSYNVPYVDIVAIALFIAWLLRGIYLALQEHGKLSLKQFPAWHLMLIFVGINSLSLINVDNEVLSYSIKYLMRPIIFFYLMYVLLPFNLIDNFRKLANVFKVFFVVGIGLSLMGIWSLIFPPIEGLRRAMPIAFGNIYPLGTNHNLLAEVFVGIIPFALILFWQEKNPFWKNFYLLGSLLMIGINLLTLSRGGWLALAVELLILIYYKYRRELNKIFISPLFYIFLLLLVPVWYLMYDLMTSYVMLSASLARLKLIDVTLTLFKIHPFIGTGVGTFTTSLWQFKWYIVEYGEVVDAHGFIFKTMAEVGIFGTLSFCALLIYIAYLLFRGYKNSLKTQYSWLISGCLMSVCGSIVFQIFGTGYYWPKLWLPIGIGLAALKLANLLRVKTTKKYGTEN